MNITDKYGRTFKTLRISLTNACNLACVYCTTTRNSLSKENLQPLSIDEIITLVTNLHKLLTLKTIRITGGEPTLYPHLVPLMQELRKLSIPSIKMTSNGYRLFPLIKPLADAGLSEINVSLDSTNEASFQRISLTKNLNTIIKSIDEALKQGIKVKLNAVIIRGVNTHEILPLLDFAQERGIVIRFLELMRMGPLFGSKKFEEYFVSQDEILNIIEQKYKIISLGRDKSATSQYWEVLGGTNFGIIANETEPFCNDCDRLRLDSFGRIYGCLSNNNSIDISGGRYNLEMLEEMLRKALAQKQEIKFTGSSISMLHIGG